MHDESVADTAYWTRRLDESACCGDESLAGGLERLKSRAAVSISALSGPVLEELTAAARRLPFRRAGREAGKPRARVYQEFDYRDHIAYTGLIALVVLAGRGRYFVCADRRGRDRREIDARPGRVILMPGPGYAGRSDRPFHMVGDITGERYSVGLRHDARESG